MKNSLKLKKATLACLLMTAGMTTHLLNAQVDPPVAIGSDDTSNVLKLSSNDKLVSINVTPDGISSSSDEDPTHALTMGKGDVLTIQGTVDQSGLSNPTAPRTSATLNYVELRLGGTKNWFQNPVSITTADRRRSVRINGDELDNNTFDFHLTGDHNGEQKIAIKAVWTVNGETKTSKIYPIVVTVR